MLGDSTAPEGTTAGTAADTAGGAGGHGANDSEGGTPSPPAVAPAADGTAASERSATAGPAAAPRATASARPANRLGLGIQFEDRPDDPEIARLIESTVWVNTAHPAYRRAHASRAESYHVALATALALAPLAVEPAAAPHLRHRLSGVLGRERRATGAARALKIGLPARSDATPQPHPIWNPTPEVDGERDPQDSQPLPTHPHIWT